MPLWQLAPMRHRMLNAEGSAVRRLKSSINDASTMQMARLTDQQDVPPLTM